MSIRFQCICGARISARDDLAGRRTRCPACGTILSVPEPAGPQPVEPEPFPLPSSPTPDAYDLITEPDAAQTSNVWSSNRSLGGPVEIEPPTWPQQVAAPRTLGPEIVERPSSPRESLYWILLFTLIPLALSLLGGRSEDFLKRLERTIDSSPPEVQQRVEGVIARLEKGNATRDDLIRALPDGKIDASAHLSRDSMVHWIYAAIASAAFLGIIAFFFAKETIHPLHLLLIGLFTGTIGIVFLIAVQYAAAYSQSVWLTRGNIIVLLIFYFVKFVGWSYSSALDPDSNFLLSAIGFTCGVGLCEELCKALPVIGYYRQHVNRSAMGWRGACLWGLASGIGFGVSEGIMYAGDEYNGISGWDIYVVRFVSCVALHAMWSASTSMVIERRRDLLEECEQWPQTALFLLRVISVPMVLHGLYDTLLKKEYESVALVMGLLSFGWFALNIQWSEREEEVSPRASLRRASRIA